MNICATRKQVSGRLTGSRTDFKNAGPRWQDGEEAIEQRTRIPRPNAVVDVGHPVENVSPLTRIDIHSNSLARPAHRSVWRPPGVLGNTPMSFG